MSFIAQYNVDRFLFSGEICLGIKIGKVALIFNRELNWLIRKLEWWSL